MAILTESRSVEYEGDGADVSFPVPFKFLADADLVVAVTYDGTRTVKTLDVHYTVTGENDDDGGTVTFVTAPVDGSTVTIERAGIEFTQPVAFRSQGTFSPATHERALDRLTMIAQELRETDSDNYDDLDAQISALRDDIAADPDAATVDARTVVAADTTVTTTTARSLAARFAQVVNVKDFGAVGDGVARDDDNIQAAIDAVTSGNADPALGVRVATRAVYLPAGTYRLTSGLLIESMHSLKFYGDGSGKTILAVDGAIGTVLDLNGTAYCEFHDFSIESLDGGGDSADATANGGGSDRFDVGIKVRWDNTASVRSSTANKFRNIAIGTQLGARFKVGFQIGSDLTESANVQEDQTQWIGCRVVGRNKDNSTWWQEGVRVGSGVFGNNLIHTFLGLETSLCKYGVRCCAGQAAFYGGTNQTCEVDWRFDGTTGYWFVSGFRSESSERIIQTHGTVAYAAHVTFADCQFRLTTADLNADKRAVYWTYPGCLAFNNCSFSGGESDTLAPKMYLDGGSKFLVVLVDGMQWGGAATSANWIDASSAGALVQARGVVFYATDGTVSSWFTGTVYSGTGKLEFGALTGAVDTNLYRSAANILKTDDKFVAALGIGVGNSASGSTPGTCVKKMEVFDASGASLGFVPIYDAIT